MAQGKAIFDYADEEEQQPLLAQYHEDGQLFLTFFDLRLRKPVTITTHAGAEHFLRDAANLVEQETWYTQRISFLEEQHQLGQLIISQLNDRLNAWAVLNKLDRSKSNSLELLDKVLERATHQISREAALDANERMLHSELMCFLARYQDESGKELATDTLKRLIAQTEDTSALRTITVQQERQLVGQNQKLLDLEDKLGRVRANYHALADRLENWGEGWRLSLSVAELLSELINRAEQSQLREEENMVLREHVDQAIANREAKAEELTEAQYLLADLDQVLNSTAIPPADILERLRKYVADNSLIPSDGIPF